MSDPASDTPAWAREHQASFEIAPLQESHEGKRVQVGFTLTLYALLPAKDPGAERQAAGMKVWERLREIALALAPKQDSPVRLEIDPPRVAAVLRPENELKPEIALQARAFHADDTFAEVTEAERDKIGAAAKRLTEMGLRQGHW